MAKKADRLLREIRTLVDKIPVCRVRPLQIMEVCGGHTHAIFKWGLKDYCRTASSLCMARLVRSACCRWGGSTIASHWPSTRT